MFSYRGKFICRLQGRDSINQGRRFQTINTITSRASGLGSSIHPPPKHTHNHNCKKTCELSLFDSGIMEGLTNETNGSTDGQSLQSRKSVTKQHAWGTGRQMDWGGGANDRVTVTENNMVISPTSAPSEKIRADRQRHFLVADTQLYKTSWTEF